MAIDEAMVGFKGRHGMKQYMPGKPTKWGFKVWMICDSHNGYCSGFQVYTGRSEAPGEFGLAYRVVMNLAEPYLGSYHHVYFDNFFASLQLHIDLLAKKTYVCSTLRLNRPGLPNEIRKCKLKSPGEMLKRQSGNFLATVWYDKRQVALLSTNQNPNDKLEVRENDQVISKPVAISNYTKYMGGVDRADQYRSYYPVGRESKKWWKYLSWYCINLSIVNSFILFSESVRDKRKKRYTQLDFRMDLEKGLRAGYTSRKNRIGRTPRQENLFPSNIYNIVGHALESINGRKRICRMCSKSGRRTPSGRKIETKWICKICEVPLCQACNAPFHKFYPSD